MLHGRRQKRAGRCERREESYLSACQARTQSCGAAQYRSYRDEECGFSAPEFFSKTEFLNYFCAETSAMDSWGCLRASRASEAWLRRLAVIC